MALTIKKHDKKETVYDIHVPETHNFYANDILIHNCTEILEVTNEDEIAVCNLASVNLPKFVVKGYKQSTPIIDRVDWDQLAKTTQIAVRNLDKVIDINFYSVDKARNSNKKWRPIGFGVMGFHFMLIELGLHFEHDETPEFNKNLFAFIYYHALKESCELAKKYGKFQNYDITKLGRFGQFQFDLWNESPKEHHGMDWDSLRADIQKYGIRNSLISMIAPTATSASMFNSSESIEPMAYNFVRRETLSGDFIQINGLLIKKLKSLGLWNNQIRDAIIENNGSVQGIPEIPDDIKMQFKTAWEMKMRCLIDLAAGRGPYIDQSQSLNLYMETPNIGKLSSMYYYAWQQGLKTTYYLRSRPASNITKLGNFAKTTQKEPTNEEIIACSLENPESCEMCT